MSRPELVNAQRLVGIQGQGHEVVGVGGARVSAQVAGVAVPGEDLGPDASLVRVAAAMPGSGHSASPILGRV